VQVQAAPVQLGPATVVSVQNKPLQRLPEPPKPMQYGAPVRTGIMTGVRQLPFQAPPLPEPVIPSYQQAQPVTIAPQIQAVQAPPATYAAPVQTVQAAPVTYAAPTQTMQAAPMTYAAPMQTMTMQAAPVTYGAPVTYAAPMQTTYAAAPAYGGSVSMGAFDAMDRNHDGVISRAEFAGMVR